MADLIDLSLPFRQGPDGFPQPATGSLIIRDSILQILLTEIGERVFQPEFGSFLRRFVFESQSPELRTAVTAEVLRAVGRWEPRATDLGVSIEFEDRTALVSVFYTQTTTGERAAVTMGFPRT